MLRVFLNGAERVLENVPGTWGDLLTIVEHDAAARGEVVSAVRIDGVDAPAFHEHPQLARTLATVRLVDIDTGTPAGLLASALAEGEAAAITLAAAARETALAFRTGELTAAHHTLAALCEGVRSLLAVLSIGSQTVGQGLDGTRWDGQPVSGRLVELTALLETLVEAQQAGNWSALADLLERELHPRLRAAAPLLLTLRETMPAGPTAAPGRTS